MAEKKAAQATAFALLTVLIVAAIGFLYFSWSDAQRLAQSRQSKISELEGKVGALNDQLDNLSLQNEELTDMLSGEQSKLAEAEKKTQALQAAEKRMKAKMEATLAKASQERADFAAKLEAEKKNAETSRASLEEKLNRTISSKDVVISRLKDQLRVDVADKILFKLASAELLPGGKQVLDQLGLALSQSPDQMIVVAGHTDDLAMKKGSLRFPTNWELSAARALAAVRYLEEVCGIPGEQLKATANGPYHPRVPNDSDENRAKNRRIEIFLTPINPEV
ncbi:MAG: OmpA family protein [Verrucomicrobiota bacterium]